MALKASMSRSKFTIVVLYSHNRIDKYKFLAERPIYLFESAERKKESFKEKKKLAKWILQHDLPVHDTLRIRDILTKNSIHYENGSANLFTICSPITLRLIAYLRNTKML